MSGPSLRKRRHQKPVSWELFHNVNVQNAKRIAELEAELAFYRGLKDLQELKARAENAEAEVERLKKVLSFAIQVLDEYEPEWREPMEEELKDVGRESESLSARKATPKTCEFCGETDHEYDEDCPAWNWNA